MSRSAKHCCRCFSLCEEWFLQDPLDNQVPENDFLYQMVLLVVDFLLKMPSSRPRPFNLVDSLPPILEREVAFK